MIIGKGANAEKGRKAQAETRAERRRADRERAQAESRISPSIAYPQPLRALLRSLPANLRMRAIALVEGRTHRQDTFREFVDRVKPDYLWGPHLVALAGVLQDVADGLRTRVMCFMPPRHGKSEQISRLFTAYYLYRHPGLQVALTTYGAELSYELSREARDNFIAGGGLISSDANAVKTWRTAQGGNLWATGVGGPAGGRGFHLGIIDDPYKDAGEAASLIVRRSRMAWYRSVFSTRKAPGAAIVILLTRWHQDDLASTLLREEVESKQGWHLLEIPAERYRDHGREPKLAPTVTREPDARDHETWLWTNRFSVAEYEATKREQGGAGGYFWNALFQQRPVTAEGGLFREEWIQRRALSEIPRATIADVRHWDLAATHGSGAFTAGLRVRKVVGPGGERQYWILGLVHGQMGAGERDVAIAAAARGDGPGVIQSFPVDPGAAGKQVATQFVRMLDGISPVRLTPESGSKMLRAQMPASTAATGGLYIVDEPWATTVIRELSEAGEGAAFFDIVDALSGAFAVLGPLGEDDASDGARGSFSLRTNR